MGSDEATVTMPQINFSVPNLSPGTPNYELVKSQVKNAVEGFGMFIAVYEVPEELRKTVFSSLKDLFNLPLENKKKNLFDIPLIGHTRYTPSAPIAENLGFLDPTSLDKVESVTNYLWPQGNLEFSKTMQSFASIVKKLQEIIRKMILESLGLEKYMEEHLNSTEHALKVKKYDAPFTSEKQVGIKTHIDICAMTILYDNQAKGLEVQSRDGQWVDVALRPNSFLVHIGESFCAWSNDRLYANPHNVMMTGDVDRYSLAFLTFYKEGYIVKAPEELVDEEHPRRYKPFDYVKYLKYFTNQVVTNNKFVSLEEFSKAGSVDYLMSLST